MNLIAKRRLIDMKNTFPLSRIISSLYMIAFVLCFALFMQSCHSGKGCSAYPNRVTSSTSAKKPKRAWGNVQISKKHKSLQLKTVKAAKQKKVRSPKVRSPKVRATKAPKARNQGAYGSRSRAPKSRGKVTTSRSRSTF